MQAAGRLASHRDGMGREAGHAGQLPTVLQLPRLYGVAQPALQKCPIYQSVVTNAAGRAFLCSPSQVLRPTEVIREMGTDMEPREVDVCEPAPPPALASAPSGLVSPEHQTRGMYSPDRGAGVGPMLTAGGLALTRGPGAPGELRRGPPATNKGLIHSLAGVPARPPVLPGMLSWVPTCFQAPTCPRSSCRPRPPPPCTQRHPPHAVIRRRTECSQELPFHFADFEIPVNPRVTLEFNSREGCAAPRLCGKVCACAGLEPAMGPRASTESCRVGLGPRREAVLTCRQGRERGLTAGPTPLLRGQGEAGRGAWEAECPPTNSPPRGASGQGRLEGRLQGLPATLWGQIRNPIGT